MSQIENKEIIEDIELQEIDSQQDEEMYEHFNLIVDKGQSLTRIDRFLANRMESTSRSRIQAAVEKETIQVNGVAVKASYKIKPGDSVSVVLPYPKREHSLEGEDIPLNILYEDKDLLLVNKEAGMVVHPGFGNFSGTMVHALTFYLRSLPMFQEGDVRAGLVHRIDKNTSGILVVAKNDRTHVALAKQFFDHTIERRYIALVWGHFEENEGTITGNIGRSVKNRLKMAVFADGSEGKHAVTHYKVLKRYGYVTLIECQLETGRTHQIRVHMESIGHPLFNDDRYGGDRIIKGTTFTKYKQFIDNCFSLMPRHALHARSLGFTHPTTGEHIYKESILPADFEAVLAKWDIYVSSRDVYQEDYE